MLGGPEFVRVDPDSARLFPFLMRVLRRCAWHFQENRKGAPVLIEFRLFDLMAPSGQADCPEVGKLHLLFMDDGLSLRLLSLLSLSSAPSNLEGAAEGGVRSQESSPPARLDLRLLSVVGS